MKRIFAKNFARYYEKNNNARNIRRLVNETIVTSTQQSSISYQRLSDLRYSNNGEFFVSPSIQIIKCTEIFFCIYKPQILDPKIEEFPSLVYKLSVK